MESKHRFLLKIYPDTLESTKHRRIFISPNEMRRRNGKILRNQRIILKQNFSTLLSISTDHFSYYRRLNGRSRMMRWIGFGVSIGAREGEERGSTPIGIGDAGRLIIFHGRLRGSVTTSRRLPTQDGDPSRFHANSVHDRVAPCN